MANACQVEELSSLEAIYDGEDVVLHLPAMDECAQSPRSLQVLITLEVPTAVLICVDSTSSKASVSPLVKLCRSGSSYQGSRRLLHLPPLRLSVSLPSDYLQDDASEHVPPQFELSSTWLSNSQLGQLCEQMDGLWNNHLGEPILFVWLEWLRSQSATFLDILDQDIIYLAEPVGELVDHRAVSHCNDPIEALLALMHWDEAREQESAQQCPPSACSNCACPLLGHLIQYSRLCCSHLLCTECTAIVDLMHTAANSMPCCPLPGCRAVLTKPINAFEAPGDLGNALGWLLGTPLQDDIVFCPFCESVAVDTPVLFDVTERSKEIVAGALHECHCYRCRWTFCGTCRSPCHPGEKCVDKTDRAMRMLRRRPPLSKKVAEKLEVSAACMKSEDATKTDDVQLLKTDCVDFEAFRGKFMSLHKASVLQALGARSVDLRPAPMAESVRNNFMNSVQNGIRGGRVVPEIRPAFHGTSAANHTSIFAHGLLIPGQGNDLEIVNGAVHGRGIYTANIDAAWLSLGFCSHPRILICAVLQLGSVTFPGDAMVVFNPSHVIPLFEAFLNGPLTTCCYGVNLTVAAKRHIANATAAAKEKSNCKPLQKVEEATASANKKSNCKPVVNVEEELYD